ncbi:hypothetical protein S83_000062 [Arachis hypogaea]
MNYDRDLYLEDCTRYPLVPHFSNSFLHSKCPSLHQRKQTLAASTNRRRRLSEWEIAAAVRRTQELPSSCSRASCRILRVVCSHLASLLCARLLTPPSASECSSCARWLLLVVRGCLCSNLPPSVTRVSSQSLASRGSPVSSPAAEATRGVVSCFVAFRGVVADSPSTVGESLHHRFPVLSSPDFPSPCIFACC